MAEGDHDKEADVTKPPLKRPLDHVPLKIIIKRKRPDAEKNANTSLSPPKLRKLVIKKTRLNGALPLNLPPEYAGLSTLVNVLRNEKPTCFQEVWHCFRKQQQDIEEDRKLSGRTSFNSYVASGTCDFGAECEMPWLHPVIDLALLKNCSKEKQDPIATNKCPSAENLSTCEAEEIDENVEDVRFHDWRFGAAKHWYDVLNVPDNCKNFTYGYKLKKEPPDCEQRAVFFPDDAFLMVSQLHWEDDVIWNGSDLQPEVIKAMKSKWLSVGGVEQLEDRFIVSSRFGLQHRLPSYLQSARGRNFYAPNPMVFKAPYSVQIHTNKEKGERFKTILPYDNEELKLGTWESEIIWDSENMVQIPRPKIPTLDPSDENIIIGIPDDVSPFDPEWSSQNSNCVKLSHPYIKGAKIMISKTGVSNVTEDSFAEHFLFEDPFNVSNDSYYALKSSETSLRLKPVGKLIQHSIPILELRQPYIPTNLSVPRLQNFHRPALKKYSHGLLAQSGFHPVYSLSREISLKAKLREDEREASGGGEVFFMREADDLTGRDGDLVLIEFTEEHPLLINEVGMCSKIINHYKRKVSKDQGPPELRYGEVVYPHTSPFLGVLAQGQCIQTVENNLYRCPIFEHKIRDSDFLVIRTRHSFSIREMNAVFVAGQQIPLYEVPAPHSKCATKFTRDFLQVYILRMFLNCPDTPKWVKMDEIKRAFPLINDLNIRKCLKLYAEFKRVDAVDASCWVLRPDFHFPAEEEIRAMVVPEQCCAQFSMLAAEQRLKDAGYGGNFIFVPSDDEEEEEGEERMKLKIDDEVKAAPWNLTRTFIQSLNGKCMLDLTGPTDPTGCGEGFSYLTRRLRQGKQAIEQVTQEEHTEKHSVASARLLLKKMGVPEKEIKKLSSWELVDIARTISKKKMKGKGRAKIAKPKPMTTAEHIAKYKEECQRIFDLQNKVLTSCEELSTDEEEMSDDGSDVEEMGKIVEKLISNGKSYSEVYTEKEELERQELVKMMMNDNAQKQSSSKEKLKKHGRQEHSGPQPDRVLKINRTFRDSNGKEYTRVEFVRKSSVIDIYLKIRGTKDQAFISRFAALESAEKQKILKEKRKIEGQLLRLKQREHILNSKQDSNNPSEATSTVMPREERQDNGQGKPVPGHSKPLMGPPSRRAFNSRMDAKRRCGACGNPGHKRGNKACPQYCGPVNVAMTEEEEEEYHRQMNIDDQNLVNVDGTKLKLSVKLIKRAEEMKKKTLVLRVPKDIVRKRKKPIADTHCDYLEKYQRPVNRRRVDPFIVISNAFETILNEMRDMPDSDPFHFPVNTKTYPHYTSVVSHPMDLQTIRENLRQKKYHSRKDFLEAVHQIVQNSSLFNGPESPFTVNARKMLDLCVKRMGEQEDELIRLEETTNPSDDEKDQVFVPQREAKMPTSDLGDTQTVSKSIVDLAISDTEDEAELETGYLDSRACPVVP